MINQKGIIILSDDKFIECATPEEAVTAIKTEYSTYPNCVGEMLENVSLIGYSVQDAVDIFAIIMNDLESDVIIQVADGDVITRGRDNLKTPIN